MRKEDVSFAIVYLFLTVLVLWYHDNTSNGPPLGPMVCRRAWKFDVMSEHDTPSLAVLTRSLKTTHNDGQFLAVATIHSTICILGRRSSELIDVVYELSLPNATKSRIMLPDTWTGGGAATPGIFAVLLQDMSLVLYDDSTWKIIWHIDLLQESPDDFILIEANMIFGDLPCYPQSEQKQSSNSPCRYLLIQMDITDRADHGAKRTLVFALEVSIGKVIWHISFVHNHLVSTRLSELQITWRQVRAVNSFDTFLANPKQRMLLTEFNENVDMVLHPNRINSIELLSLQEHIRVNHFSMANSVESNRRTYDTVAIKSHGHLLLLNSSSGDLMAFVKASSDSVWGDINGDGVVDQVILPSSDQCYVRLRISPSEEFKVSICLAPSHRIASDEKDVFITAILVASSSPKTHRGASSKDILIARSNGYLYKVSHDGLIVWHTRISTDKTWMVHSMPMTLQVYFASLLLLQTSSQVYIIDVTSGERLSTVSGPLNVSRALLVDFYHKNGEKALHLVVVGRDHMIGFECQEKAWVYFSSVLFYSLVSLVFAVTVSRQFEERSIHRVSHEVPKPKTM